MSRNGDGDGEGGAVGSEETESCWVTYETLPKSEMYFDVAQDKWFKDEACAQIFAAREAAQPRSSKLPPGKCCCGMLNAQFSYEGTRVSGLREMGAHGPTVPVTVCCWGLCYLNWCCSGALARDSMLS
jgi:hypothetical protein